MYFIYFCPQFSGYKILAKQRGESVEIAQNLSWKFNQSPFKIGSRKLGGGEGRRQKRGQTPGVKVFCVGHAKQARDTDGKFDLSQEQLADMRSHSRLHVYCTSYRLGA